MRIRSIVLLSFVSLTGIAAHHAVFGHSAATGGKMRYTEIKLITTDDTGWYEDEHRHLNFTSVPDTTEQEFVQYSINGASVSINNTTVGKIIQSPDDIYPNSILIEATGGANAADLHFRFNNEQVVVGGNRPLYHVMNGIIGFP